MIALLITSNDEHDNKQNSDSNIHSNSIDNKLCRAETTKSTVSPTREKDRCHIRYSSVYNIVNIHW